MSDPSEDYDECDRCGEVCEIDRESMAYECYGQVICSSCSEEMDAMQDAEG